MAVEARVLGARVLAPTKDMPREEWLRIRRGGLGGSDAAAVCGFDTWRSPLTVYLDKLGQLPDREPSDAMAWGTRIEPLVADWFAEDTGYRVQRRLAILQHSQHPWMLADVDRLVREPDGTWAVLECKTTNAYSEDEWADGIPERVRIQCLHYAEVLDTPRVHVACLIGGQHPVRRVVERDARAMAALVKIEDQFWRENVQAQVPPPAEGTEADAEALSILYPHAQEGEAVGLPLDGLSLLRLYRDLGPELEETQRRRDEAKQRLCQMLGTAEAGVLDGLKVCTWRNGTDKRIDPALLREKYPDAAAECTVERPKRTFLLTRDGKTI